MSETEIFIDRTKYRHIRDAATAAGISSSYLSKFCREGEVKATRVDGVWFVNETSLRELLEARNVKKREWHERLTAERIAERAAPVPVRAFSRDFVPLPRSRVAPRTLHRVTADRRAREASTRRTFVVASVASLLFISSLGFAFSGVAPAIASRDASVASIADIGASIARRFTSFFDSIFAVNDYTIPPAWEKTVIEESGAARTGNTVNNTTNNNYVTNNNYIQTGAASGNVSERLFDNKLTALENHLSGRIDLLAYEGQRQTEDLAEDFANGMGGGGFDDIDITDSSFSGGSISGSTLSGVNFSGETSFPALVASDATTTNLYIEGSFGFGTSSGLLQTTNGTASTLANGGNGQVLKMVGGNLAWSTDLTGGGGGGGASFFASTTDDLAIYLADPTDVVIIGDSATTSVGHILEVAGNALLRGGVTTYGPLTAPRFVATSSTASVLPYASTTAISTNSLCISGDCRQAWPTDSAFSTTSADYWKSITSFFSTSSADYYTSVNNFFSTSSANYWKTANDFFSTTSASYFLAQNQGTAFSTSSADHLLSTYGKGFFFSTSSANYFLSQNGALGFSTTSNDYWLTQRNFFSTTSADAWKDQRNFFSTSSASYFASTGLAFSTTSNEYWKSVSNFFSTTSADAWKDQRNFFSTTSASYFLAQNGALGFSTTSANYFVSSSTTLPKTYSANTFTALQTFGNASSSIFSANTICLSTDCRTSWPTAGSSFDYPFSLSGNATSTLTQFNGGLTAFASSTIGNGTAAGGLTVNGTATTSRLVVTSTATSTFAGDILMGGSIIPSLDNTYSLGSESRMWKDVYIGPGSLYVNGKKVIEDVSNTITISTDNDQNLMSETSGVGNNTMRATGSGNMNLLSSSGNINVTSTSGNINIGTSGSGQLNLGIIASGTWQGMAIADNYLVKNGNWTGTFDGYEASQLLADGFSTTSADFWKTQRDFFSTTSASYFLSQNQGAAFSTTSASYFLSTQGSLGFSTTSNDYWKSVNNFFSTSSADYYKSVNDFFSTTSADYWGSTKGYSNFSYLFPNNATSTLLAFNGGLTAFASSTIGSGSTTTGLTINGGATTTGMLYVGGQMSIGAMSPLGALRVNGNIYTDADTYIDGTGNGSDSLTFHTNFMSDGVTLFISDRGSAPYVGTASTLNLGTTAATPIVFLTNSTERMRLTETGNLGVGTTTPLGKLSVHANSNETNPILFAVGSSTASATTTLFSIANTGQVLLDSTVSATRPALSFSAAPNAGMYWNAGGGSIGFSVAGARVFYIESTTITADNLASFRMNSGTGAAPAYSFSGDTNMGIFRPGNDLLAFSTNGRERARFTDTGNLGVGTTTPLAKLSVHANDGETNTSLFSIASSTGSATTTLFSISNTGSTTASNGFNITAGCYAVNGTCITGGGGASFAYPFLLNGNATSTLTQFNGGLTAYASSTIGNGTQGLSISGGATTTGSLFVGTATGGTVKGSQELVLRQDGDTYGSSILRLRNRDNENGAIFETTDPTVTLIDFIFKTADAQRNIRFESRAASADAGDPSFHIGGASPDSSTFMIGDSLIRLGNGDFDVRPHSGNDAGDIIFKTSANSQLGRIWTETTGAAGLSLSSGDSIADLFIDANGNIGIGTTSPYAKLSVAGDIVGARFIATTSTASIFPYASTTALSATTLCLIGDSCIASWPTGGGAAYPFSLTGNATSTLTQFNGGLTAFASSTIGNGSVTGGLTVSGTATTSALIIDGNTITLKNGANNSMINSSGSAPFVINAGSSGNGMALQLQQQTYLGLAGSNTATISQRSGVGLLINAISGQTGNFHEWRNSAGTGLGAITTIGNLGLGTTTPYAQLSLLATSTSGRGSPTTLFAIASTTGGVSTTTLFSISNTGSTTASNGFNITAGCYAMNGTCLSSGSASLTGTTGQLAYFSGTNTAVGTSSLFLASNGNVGIGNTSPLAALHVGAGATATNFPDGAGGSFNPQILTSQTSGVAGIGASVNDGVNNRRIALFVNDTDSVWGLSQTYTTGAVPFVIRSGSAEQLRITNSGLVGIGTSSPWGNLSIDSTAGTPQFVIGSSTATQFIVDKSGNVGIGDTAPSQKLVVDGAIGLMYTSNGQSFNGIRRNGVATEYFNGITSTDANVIHNFLGSSDVSKMVITEGGDIGIGTTSPLARLHVAVNSAGFTPSANADELFIERLSNAGMTIGSTNTATGNIYFGDAESSAIGRIVYDHAVNDLSLWTNNSERVTVNSSGNVGIGTTTPVSTLSVQGSLCVRSTGSCGVTAGTIYATTAAISDIDLAENYRAVDITLMPGEIVALDTATTSTIRRAVQGEESLGVLSTKPGLLLGQEIKDGKAVALKGRVPLKVNMEGGAIAVGDRLTISSVPGIGTKATTSAYTVARALEATSVAGEIEVFVENEYTLVIEERNALADLLHATSTSSSSAVFANIFARMTSWLADAGNGITEIFAKTIRAENVYADTVTANEICVKKSDGTHVCVTGDELEAVLGSSGSTPSAPAPTPEPEPEPESNTPPETLPDAPEETADEPSSVESEEDAETAQPTEATPTPEASAE